MKMATFGGQEEGSGEGEYLPGRRARQGRDQPQLSGSTQRLERELHVFPRLPHSLGEEAGGAKRRDQRPAPSTLGSSPVACRTLGGKTGRGDAEKGRDWVSHLLGAPAL